MAATRKRLRAGLYPRKSKAERRAGNGNGVSHSVTEQEARGRADAAEHHWTVVDVFPDDGKSASRFGTKVRDEWARLREVVDAGRLDLVWLWEVDRASRELDDWVPFLTLCRRRGVLVHVHTHHRTYDPRVARDRRALVEDGLDAEYDSEKKSLNIRRALQANAEGGRPHGPATYGYRRDYRLTGDGRRVLVAQRVDRKAAAIVREIFRRVAAAEPLVHVTRDLNDRRVPSPKDTGWKSATVRSIVRNPAYVGRRRHTPRDGAGATYTATWPAIVDELTWQRAQRVLDDPARHRQRPGRVKWLLSSVIDCGKCGQGLVGRARYDGRGMPTIYTCPKGCTAVNAPWLERFMVEVVVARLSRPDVYRRLARADDRAAQKAADELAVLTNQLQEHYDQAAHPDPEQRLSAAGLAAVEKRLMPQIEAARKRAEAAALPPPLRDLLDPGEDVRARWDALPVAARKDVVRTLLSARLLPAEKRGSHSEEQVADRVEITWKTR